MAFFHIRGTKNMDMYIYSDEFEVFDYLHNDYFVFSGVIFFSKQNNYQNYLQKLQKHVKMFL